MFPRLNAHNLLHNSTGGSAKQRTRALRRHDSVFVLQPNPITYKTDHVEPENATQKRAAPTSGISLEGIPRCEDLWFEDGDIIVWAQTKNDSVLFRVHRRVLKESGAEPFCTIVDCTYPSPETSEEIFLDGILVVNYGEQDPVDIMYVLKWMYERPSISKRSTVPFAALKIYLERSALHFIPAMRRCVLEYLWNMFPTNLNYHQRVPTLVEDCYSENPALVYKPHVLFTLILLSAQHQLVAILPLIYYYIAQWPMDWITNGVPGSHMEYDYTTTRNDFRFKLLPEHAMIVLVGREKLIRMRENTVFNFIEDFTSSGVTLDLPTRGCDGEERPETGETCFEWLMRLWYSMCRFGFIARPSALDIMNMGQWAELQKNCCKACSGRVIEHMLNGRDDVWKSIPGAFGCYTWEFVVEQQKGVEKGFGADIH